MLLLALSCSSPEVLDGPVEPVERASVRLGLAADSTLHGIAWVAEDAGIFDAHGLDVDIEVLEGSRAVVRALDDDTLDWGLCDGATVLRWDFEGGDLVLVASLSERSHRRVYAKKALSVSRLRHKRIAVGQDGGAEHLSLMLALDQLGVPPDEVEFVHGLERTFQPVRSREVDAQITLAPAERLEANGFHVVFELSDADVPYTTLQLATRDRNARAPEAERMVSAFRDAAALIEADPAKAASLLSAHLDIDDVAGRLERQGPFQVRTDHSEGLQALIDLLAREDVLYRGHRAEELLP